MDKYTKVNGIRVCASHIPTTTHRLTTVGPKFSLSSDSGKRRIWQVCLCSCGQCVVAQVDHLRSGHTKSCGCYKDERAVETNTTHGMGHTVEYRTYAHMLDRCFRKTGAKYRRYGGRGITVHPDWVGEGGFERFLAHIGPRPSNKHSVDRINNDGNYEPGNVRWATTAEQASNTSRNVYVTIDGRRQHMSAWCRELGMCYDTFVRVYIK